MNGSQIKETKMRVNNANAFVGTFVFLPPHKAKQKIQKSHQATAAKTADNGQKNHDKKRTTKA